ncbi:MAG TPA: SPOR domain-containing protein [Terriglobales bacterium]|jgi:cell division septation protein DedD
MGSTQDTEITLGTGKMLVLFFGLVALCGVFFGVGYSLGRSSSKPELAAADPAASTGALRPSVKTVTPSTDNSSKPADLTFYKTVEQKDANPQLTPAESKAASTSPAPSTDSAAASATTNAAPDPAMVSNPNSYFVQVAAVSKQEDAEALVDSLKKKQYPAFTANGSADKLFHVQVGPYSDIKDAEGMRAKLIADGYNPILKR